jgi:hypothetical protein
VTCPLHVHLVESEPIIPVPEPEHYDDDTSDGGHRHGNDRNTPSEETHTIVSRAQAPQNIPSQLLS